MELATLRNELSESAYTKLSAAQAADLLNAPNITRRKEHFVTDRTLAAVLGVVQAVTILEALRQLAANEENPLRLVHAFVLKQLQDTGAGGIDISTDESRSFVDQFAAAQLLTSEDATALKALGEETISIAQSLGLGFVGEQHIVRARMEE